MGDLGRVAPPPAPREWGPAAESPQFWALGASGRGGLGMLEVSMRAVNLCACEQGTCSFKKPGVN